MVLQHCKDENWTEQQTNGATCSHILHRHMDAKADAYVIATLCKLI